jgi:Ca2+-binding RTX toxin-like protein
MASSITYLAAESSEAAIQQAISSLTDGGTLVLPAGETILISKGLILDVSQRSITLDLNGSTLQQAGDVSVLSVKGKHVAGEAATLGIDAAANTTVTYSSGDKVSVGDWVKIYSDDVLPNDHGSATRLGQAMKVSAVAGDTLTLEGDLLYRQNYTTNIRASEYQSGKAVVEGGAIRGDQSHPEWQKDLVAIRSTVDTQINHVTVRDGNSMGLNFVDSVNGRVTQSAAINLLDDTEHGFYGYGVHSASSFKTTVEGFYADTVRHAVDDNAVGISAGDRDPSKYGADIGLTASDVIAYNTTAFAFSWHTEGRESGVTDSLVFNSYGVLGARGLDNRFSGVAGAGNNLGIMFYEYGEGDGRRIDVSNVALKENTGYAYFSRNGAAENTISNSSFEILTNKVTIKPEQGVASLVNNVLKIGAFATDEDLVGSDAADRLLGAKGNDRINGGMGNDYIWGGAGSDVLTGGGGVDRFAYHLMSEAADTITDFVSGNGGDVLDVAVLAKQHSWSGGLLANGYVRFSQAGSDTLFQVDPNGGGDDFVTLATLTGVKASTMLGANISQDVVVINEDAIAATSQIAPPLASSSLHQQELATVAIVEPSVFDHITGMVRQFGTAGADNLTGGQDADLLIGNAGDDRLSGGDGDDLLAGGAGGDTLMGGLGSDTASYADARNGVVASLTDTTMNTGDAENDRYSQIENLTGTKFDDSLFGHQGVNQLQGGGGNDLLSGMDGADQLFGEAGNDRLLGGEKADSLFGGDGQDQLFGGFGYDTLTGGSDADSFCFEGLNTGLDTITDFEHGVDKIGLGSDFGLSSLATLGFFSGSRPVAAGSGPAILWDDDDSIILFDADGSGKGAAVKIAVLEQHPTLTLSDFLLI